MSELDLFSMLIGVLLWEGGKAIRDCIVIPYLEKLKQKGQQ